MSTKRERKTKTVRVKRRKGEIRRRRKWSARNVTEEMKEDKLRRSSGQTLKHEDRGGNGKENKKEEDKKQKEEEKRDRRMKVK